MATLQARNLKTTAIWFCQQIIRLLVRAYHGTRALVERRPRLFRWILAGPIAFVLALVSLAAMPHVLPTGPGGVNHLVVPTIFLPVTWTVFIIWPVMTEKLANCFVTYVVLLIICLAIVTAALT